jgi:hypothetical protein
MNTRSCAFEILLAAGLILLAALRPGSAQTGPPARGTDEKPAKPPSSQPGQGKAVPREGGGGDGGRLTNAPFRPLDGIAARVNGEVITWNDVREKMGDVAKSLGYPTAAEREKKLAEYALNKLKILVQEELALQMAKQEGIDASKEEVDREMRRQQQGMGGPLSMLKLASDRGMTLAELRRTFKEDIMRQKFYASKFIHTPWASRLRRYSVQVSPGEIRAFYRRHRKEYRVRGAVWLRRLHISAEEHGGDAGARALGVAVIKDLKSGLTPAEVDLKRKLECDQFSCPIADLDPIYKDSGYKKQIKTWAFTNQAGAVSDLFKLSPGNYAIFYLEKKIDEKVQSFEEVQDDIRDRLRMANQNRARHLMLRDLFKNADIEPGELKRFMLNPQGPRPRVVPREIIASILGKSF